MSEIGPPRRSDDEKRACCSWSGPGVLATGKRPGRPVSATEYGDRMAKKPKPLSAKQEAFIREYLIDMNATAAAARSGYKQPNKQGPRLLVNVGIAARIRAELAKLADAAGLTPNRIWEEWRRLGLS